MEWTSWGMGGRCFQNPKKCAERIGLSQYHCDISWHMTQFCSVTHDAHAEYNINHILINVKVAQIHYSAFNEALPLKLNWCKHALPWNAIYFTFSKFILMQMLSSMCRIYLKMIAKVVKWSMHKVGCQGHMPTMRTLM